LIACDAAPEDMLKGKPHVSDEIVAKKVFRGADAIGKSVVCMGMIQHCVPAPGERMSTAMERMLGTPAAPMEVD
jgi:hypothetical protein